MSNYARWILDEVKSTGDDEKTLIERIYDHGYAEGLARAEGKGKKKAVAILKLLDTRDLALSDEQLHQVMSSTDPAQLDLWSTRAINATCVAEIFAD